jgi:hypothetical protein
MVQLAFGMDEQVVIPAGVPGAAIVRRDQDDVVIFGEVCDGSLAAMAAACTGCLRTATEIAPAARCIRPIGFQDRCVKPRGDRAVDRRTWSRGRNPLDRAFLDRVAGAGVDAGNPVDGVAGHGDLL